MSKKLVYLAGPISGQSYDECTSWRREAIEKLNPLFGLSPMRGKDYLLDEISIKDSYSDKIQSTGKAITTRDKFDCQRSDLIIINLENATKVSIGTMIEAGWADSKNIPIILIQDKVGLHQHCMLNHLAGFHASSLDEAIDIAKTLLIEELI